VDLSFLRVRVPVVGLHLSGVGKQDGQYDGADARGCDDVRILCSRGREYAFPAAVPSEVPLQEQADAAGLRRVYPGLQCFVAVHHFDAAALRDVLRCGILQALGNVRMYVEHSALADAGARFQYLFSVPLYSGAGRHTVLGVFRNVCRVLLQLAVYELSADGSAACGHLDSGHFDEDFQHHEDAAALWSRLAGRRAVVGIAARTDLYFQLWRVL